MIAAILVMFALLPMLRVEHLATAHSEQVFNVECDFAKFRQIMVRKNATAAIVGHAGMTLLDEKIQGMTLDTSADDRPLLNAIRGKSKSAVTAVKQLTVKLDDPMLEADRLVLTQDADVAETRIQVQTVSDAPAGRLESYATTLAAESDGTGSRVTVTVDMNVRVKVLMFFTGIADQRVQAAADGAVNEQAAAIEQFIGKHAHEMFILPELQK